MWYMSLAKYGCRTLGPCNRNDTGNLPVEVEPSHENNTIDTHLPLFSEHAFGFAPECACGDMFVAVLLGFKKLLALWEADTDKTNGNGYSCCCPKNSLD
jgi:hypothetical protein